jgi:hypothetical protein
MGRPRRFRPGVPAITAVVQLGKSRRSGYRVGESLEPPVSLDYKSAMPDDLYDRDALAWSEQQAALLRRVARGERVNDVDWDHVVEEIEDVGISELNAVHSYLDQILAHFLKLRGWPELDAEHHWRAEIVAFQTAMERRFAPSMRQRIDLAKIYNRAKRQIDLLRYGGKSALTPPATCPVTLEQLLTASVEDLEAAVSAPTAD